MASSACSAFPGLECCNGSLTTLAYVCSEVVTIFHEFGHTMQHTMTTETDVLVAGIAGIEQDAVEQPSQMLERW